MQHNLDKWLKDEWEPAIKKDKEIQKKYLSDTKETQENKERNFTLQEYVDKAGAYIKNAPTSEPNINKLNKLPVIGK